mmetsp:Transcript_61081/g.177015  ORF Transcript_61081/g.177015 Transcript_61081/m.177015 type:complete len:326 (-) Transcript_61081:2339-3316(-)
MTRLRTRTLEQPSKSQPSFRHVWLASSKATTWSRQHSATSPASGLASSSPRSGTLRHQWNMQSESVEASGAHAVSCCVVADLIGVASWNFSKSLFPATWLWSSGKMRGKSVSNSAVVTMPIVDNITRIAPMPRIVKGKVEVHVAKLKKMAYFRVDIFERRSASLLSRLLRPGAPRPGPRPQLLVSSVWRTGTMALNSEAFTETSIVFVRILRVRRSLTQISGGTNIVTKTKLLSTHKPMKRPNSRRGWRALAMLAKKLTAVVIEVAKQLFPAWMMTKTRRVSTSFKRALCAQKSQKTKSESTPMPVIKNTARKEARVVFTAGVMT